MKKDTILVCGGRNATMEDYWPLAIILNELRDVLEYSRIVTGLATGYDTLAKMFAEENELFFEGYPISKADWRKHGKGAGPRRNRIMFDNERHRLLAGIAFPGGNGTADMLNVLNMYKQDYNYRVLDLRNINDILESEKEAELTIS